MRRSWMKTGFAAWLSVGAVGCYTGLPSGPGGGDDPSAGDGGGDGDGDADGGDDADGDDDDDGDDDGGGTQACEGSSVAAAALRRLTGLEYDNTVRQLVGDDSPPSSNFAPDESVAGFAANSVAPISANQLDQYFAAAETIAASTVADRWDAVVACEATDAVCLDDFVEHFGRRAFRRPLTPTELAGYRELLDATRDEEGPQSAVQIVIAAMLMSPSFLYHVETAAPAGAAAELLSDHAVASRLSYFMWSSMPDDELFEVADAGMLADPDVLEVQARRMLEDDRAKASVASFHKQWLHIEHLGDLVKDAELFPEWNSGLASSMEAETLAFADEVIRHGDGTLRTLLTASWSMIDDDLAALYGATASGPELAMTQLDPDQRAGLLTHASFLASNAHAAENSWVFRGKFVREKLLCGELPPVPAGLETTDPLDPDRLHNPECAACHVQMDPIGIGLDAYSPIGAFRPFDADGNAVDVSGAIDDVPEIGAFEGAVELAHALADAPKVGDCMATQWFRYAARRKETPDDACTVNALRASFAESGQDIRELVVAIVRSDAFRFHSAQ